MFLTYTMAKLDNLSTTSIWLSLYTFIKLHDVGQRNVYRPTLWISVGNLLTISTLENIILLKKLMFIGDTILNTTELTYS